MHSASFTTCTALTRRALLRGAWLDAMLPAFGAAPMRFPGILNTLSFHTPFLFPKESGRDYAPTPYLEALQPVRGNFSTLSGLNHPEVSDGHNSDKSFLTGTSHPGSPSFRKTISLDQPAAEHLGEQTRHPSLALSAGRVTCSHTSTGVAIPPESSPARTFARLLIDGTPGEIAREIVRVEEEQFTLDHIASQAKQIQSAVGARDNEKLDQYMSNVRDLQKRMERSKNYPREAKPKPDTSAPKDPEPGDDTRLLGLLLDIVRLAFWADLTRFITIGHGATIKTPSKPEAKFAHHDLSHHGQDTGKIEQLALIEKDVVAAWGGFLQHLRDTRDTQGVRPLDRTISVLGSAMGNDSSHDSTNLPNLIGGGRFKHGQHLAINPEDPPPLCTLWLHILQELGLETARVKTSTTSTIPGLLA